MQEWVGFAVNDISLGWHGRYFLDGVFVGTLASPAGLPQCLLVLRKVTEYTDSVQVIQRQRKPSLIIALELGDARKKAVQVSDLPIISML